MNLNFKKIILTSFIFGIIFILLTQIETGDSSLTSSDNLAAIQVSDYAPLTKIKGVTNSGLDRNVGDYLQLMFSWGIGIAIILSIITLIVAGLKYMTIESVTGKSNAKEKIQAAIVGLLLALSSWLILNTINPQILNRQDNSILNESTRNN